MLDIAAFVKKHQKNFKVLVHSAKHFADILLVDTTFSWSDIVNDSFTLNDYKQLPIFQDFKNTLFFQKHLIIWREFDADVSDDDIAAKTFQAFVTKAFFINELSGHRFYNAQQLIAMMNSTYTGLARQMHFPQEIHINFNPDSFEATNPHRITSNKKTQTEESESAHCCVIS